MESQSSKYVSDACAECGGKCCRHGSIFVTNAEYESLPDDERKKQISQFKSAYVIDVRPCPYLGAGKCYLGEDRFIDCKTYPWTIDGMISDELSLCDECPGRESFDNEMMKCDAEQLFVKNYLKGKLTAEEIADYDSINYKIDKDK